MNPCKITEDLLPLYVEGACSPGSREYIEEHLKTCPQCQALLDSMKQPVELNLPKQDSKKNFRRFAGSLVRKRVLTITLCVLLGLSGLTAALWHPAIYPFFFSLHFFQRNDIDVQLSRLSDGSIFLRGTYTGDEYCIETHGLSGSEGILYLTVQHSRLNDLLRLNETNTFEYILRTADSQYVPTYLFMPVSTFIFMGADGNHILWQEGEELPPADEEAEAILKENIDSGFYIPVSEYNDSAEQLSLGFGHIVQREACA